MPRSRSLVVLAALALVLALRAPAHAQDLADGCRAARVIVARHLTQVQLNSAYGTPAFDRTGRRIGDVFLNFCGRNAAGEWMLMSLTLHPDGMLTGEHDPDNPRPDHYGHHLKLPVELEAWLPPEEAVAAALAQHAGHGEPVEISLAYTHTKEHGGRVVIVLYWLLGGVIHDVMLDARYGEVLEVGETPWPEQCGRPMRVGADRRRQASQGRS